MLPEVFIEDSVSHDPAAWRADPSSETRRRVHPREVSLGGRERQGLQLPPSNCLHRAGVILPR